MMDIYLIRHGETDFNKERKLQGRKIDAPLNETGWEQANKLVNAIEQDIDVIVTSSLIRTHQTSIPLLKAHVHFERHKELDEMSYGDLEGRVFFDVQEDIKEIHHQWSSGNTHFRVRGGESPIDVLSRAQTKVFDILNNHQRKTIVFILHGRLIRILLSEWLGYGLQNMHEIQHSNGSINHLQWDGSTFRAIYLNKVDHLK